MPIDARYHEQVRLLVSLLPFLNDEPCFALKGGTAINLFVQPLPRRSVDIDLAYLPLEPRDEALRSCREALQRLAQAFSTRLPGVRAELQDNRRDELRILVHKGRSQVKVEVSPVLRGTLHPPQELDVVEAVEDEYGFAAVQVVSLPDLYGGKICAALDRQHPRDLFDVKLLLNQGGLNRSVFEGFLVYLLGHPRPLNEVINPRLKPLDDVYRQEFVGMARADIPLQELESVRDELLSRLGQLMTDEDARFLLSFKQGAPDWALLPLTGVDRLPAVRWKLANIQKMGADKHRQSLELLEQVLGRLRP
ncbi:nucleotidyl transferase AbiEii/AbiGii toxin family protein [Halomonas janggokensis]|uniref:Nucleotidyl transferase AbiEii/AbiGii toxin family protein n=1 Tax=Vreelandella janggokensis TaxID=370767 RepID=A0ABT4IWB1_9GAMM|nr:nucleotidyl transferase AbiEii/AbiGii toxin family protein [Halomonas janggokensis]MCZ0927974.1 nucleotidyl transferase AbiEii/AbiGii toxin family protein [Halomonas janggokensis]MCZ0930568.1 nucleotidyl transferase AbiEii/AbiGii toxin family protein [Halomonas janggokensis]